VACGGAQSLSMGCPRPVSVLDTGNYAGIAGMDRPNYRGQVKLPADTSASNLMPPGSNEAIVLTLAAVIAAGGNTNRKDTVLQRPYHRLKRFEEIEGMSRNAAL
jgi:hypothetical protein